MAHPTRSPNRRVLVTTALGAGGCAALLTGGLRVAVDGPAAAQDDDAGDDDGGSGGRRRRRGGRDAAEAIRDPFPAGAVEIRIVTDDAGGFVPATVTVDLGDTVAFVNGHHDEHTATGAGFDSGVIGPGAVVSVVVDAAGVFLYACRFHPEMTGEVRVRDATGNVPDDTASSVAATAVAIADLAYDPARITVEPGQTVTWTNEDTVPHTVTADDGQFDSGILEPGAIFTWTFAGAGSVAYSCLVHPSMLGVVEVVGASGAGRAVATPGPDTPPGSEIKGLWPIVLADAGPRPDLQVLLQLDASGAAEAALAPLGPGDETFAGPALGYWARVADEITVDLVALRTGQDGVLAGTVQLTLELREEPNGQTTGEWRRNDGSSGNASGAPLAMSPLTP